MAPRSKPTSSGDRFIWGTLIGLLVGGGTWIWTHQVWWLVVALGIAYVGECLGWLWDQSVARRRTIVDRELERAWRDG